VHRDARGVFLDVLDNRCHVHRMARRFATVRGPGPFVSKMPRGAVEWMSVMLRESRSRSTTDSDLVVCKQEGD